MPKKRPLAIAIALLLCSPAGAETFNVSSVSELLQAIDDANANNEADIIALDGSTLTLREPVQPSGNAGVSGLPTISSAITINGGSGGTVIERAPDSDAPFRLLHVSRSGDLVLNTMTLRGGVADDPSAEYGRDGGGLLSEGRVTLNDSTLSGNSAAADGGSIAVTGSDGHIVLMNSTVTGNVASVGGGGITIRAGAQASIMDSLLIGNSAGRRGGGIDTYTIYSSSRLVRSTVSGNTASRGGGASSFPGTTTTIDDSTVSANTAVNGGGVYGYYANLSVRSSTVADNSSSDCGGGLFHRDSAFGLVPAGISGSIISGNSAARGGGACVVGDGSMTFSGSTVSENLSAANGGGILNLGSSVTIFNSTVSGNSTNGDGGAFAQQIGNSGYSESVIFNSTVSANTANNGGAFLISSGYLTLVNATVAANTMRGDENQGAGLMIFRDSNNLKSFVTLRNSALADSVGGADCRELGGGMPPGGNLVNVNASLIETSQCMLSDASTDNLLNQDPLLGPLAGNGGPTLTQAPQPGSPLFDAGDNALLNTSFMTDQRGTGFPRVLNERTDIGAVESLSMSLPPLLFRDHFESDE